MSVPECSRSQRSGTASPLLCSSLQHAHSGRPPFQNGALERTVRRSRMSQPISQNYAHVLPHLCSRTHRPAVQNILVSRPETSSAFSFSLYGSRAREWTSLCSRMHFSVWTLLLPHFVIHVSEASARLYSIQLFSSDSSRLFIPRSATQPEQSITPFPRRAVTASLPIEIKTAEGTNLSVRIW